ncbi:poly-beta-1,6-N-acetyl-D-glucosamine synthase [Alkanindiges illinoisensis]|uniref:Poly-beta-1,6-N-acetyl-D-glucosamine synthase n=1 Tax=Alkanindiges illinoisensis TaxID=197183 RepID=A0A4Y7XCY7_9GAMM|nr:poly-beta-1,6-N-acetyl-D-glucosamine synthase [Alkanindiges illinoisensis]TEU27324.1 poly-beta-1,6 N-acetyl-D-glucosamine synthase [Alkanindiges illinoisensis]
MLIDALNWLQNLSVRNALFAFAFYYPLLMAWLWIIGGIWFYLRRELRRPALPQFDQTARGCSILIPCYNEEQHVTDTIRFALATRYPNIEVIVINDGSTDQTEQIVEALAKQDARIRIVHLTNNQGKAFALRAGALVSKYEYLVCIDGDALLHPYTVHWMMDHLLSGPRVGAVTGNPRIINRSSLLGKIQVGEFSSIIGLIKRAQRTYGRIFTVSGAIAGFRKTALHRVGYWSENIVTEDIDISWRLQLDHWDIRYEAQALCYLYMPETLKGLWSQRLRWAQGGVEVLLKYGKALFHWKARRFWGVAFEYLLSVGWSYAMLIIFMLYFTGLVVDLPESWYVASILPQVYGLFLGVTCLVQFFISLWMDRRYDQGRILRNYIWVIWYPLLYWILSMLTTVVALPKALLKRSKKRARWESPDRGISV